MAAIRLASLALTICAGPALAQSDQSVCNIYDIRGATLPPITSDTEGCGIEKPVKVTSVAGISLSTPATLDCPTAKALRTWVVDVAIPVLGRKGGLDSLQVAGSYVCRPRNNKKGAKMSEHSLGHAIDISGFGLKNGKVITVKDDWFRSRNSIAVRSLHRKACGIFGTVLGPKADKHHRDHFHFDTARYRTGNYCR